MRRLKTLFDEWAQQAKGKYTQKQWLLSKWEVLDGIDWPDTKVNILIKNIREALRLERSHSLLDIGCGGGWIMNSLKPTVKRVVGLDISLEMLKTAHLAFAKENFICGDACWLPVKEGTFDRVLCYFVFINFGDPDHIRKAILDFMRILKKGGRVLIGQIPDRQYSSHYDAAKEEYLEYCRRNFKVGENIRDICLVPVHPLDRKFFIDLLEKEKIPYQIRSSFNPFYRDGQPETVDWRFDLILEKK